ncbi:MAG: hypothetical protein QF473_18680 [Planctomycetota bacterium]|jgi:hypothetical protein|nr:hypothetical protein [Planctomycetota bacterium]
MKTRILSALLIVAAVALIVWVAGKSPQQVNVKAASVDTDKDVLHVDDYMRNIESYQDQVTISGVVSDTFAEQQLFTIIDTSEFERCLTTDCSLLYLPVKWKGEMPTQRDWVKVKGKISESGSKLVFAAETLEKLEPLVTGTKQ